MLISGNLRTVWEFAPITPSWELEYRVGIWELGYYTIENSRQGLLYSPEPTTIILYLFSFNHNLLIPL